MAIFFRRAEANRHPPSLRAADLFPVAAAARHGSFLLEDDWMRDFDLAQLRLPDRCSDADVAEAAAARRLAVSPGSACFPASRPGPT